MPTTRPTRPTRPTGLPPGLPTGPHTGGGPERRADRVPIVRQRLATHDPDQAHARLARLYTSFRPCPDRAGRREQPFVYRDCAAQAGPLMTHRVQYTSGLDFSLPAQQHVVLVHVLEGILRMPVGDDAGAAIGPGGVYLCPAGEFDGSLDGVDALSLTLPLAAVRTAAEAAAGTAAAACGLTVETLRPALAVGRVADDRAARTWAATMAALHRQLLPDRSALARPVLLTETVQHLAAALLQTFPGLAAPTGRTAPRTGTLPAVVVRAMSFMDDNAHRPVTQAQVAEAAGVGVRALQLAFRRHLDTTPQRYLRRVRLAHAHRDLRAADPSRTTVAQIAARWGFSHPGRFSRYHVEEFGTSPSTTLFS